MEKERFSQDLASLVHHVELSDAGWRDRALDIIAASILFRASGPLEVTELATSIQAQLGAPVARAQVEALVTRLERTSQVVVLPGGKVKLTETTTQSLTRQIADGVDLEQRTEAKYHDLFSSLPAECQVDWQEFRDSFLAPLVGELGAHTYELLSGQEVEIKTARSYVTFLNQVPVAGRAEVSSRIAAFLDPRDVDIRSFVLRQLNTAFLLNATTIPEASLERLLQRTKRQLRLRVFVDTNFLFSLIGLHENPADDVVEALHGLIVGLEGRVNAALYVLPITLDEARRTVIGYESRLSGIWLTPVISRAVRDGTGDMSGITLKFIREGLQAKKRLSAEQYFRPYQENLIEVCRSKGVSRCTQIGVSAA